MDAEQETAAPIGAEPPSNFERLAKSLHHNGLAAALLKAWTTTAPTQRQAALVKAVRDFHKPKETPGGEPAAQ
jgi:hypothetical protein